MLVCRECGTRVDVAGAPCPRCGARSAIDARFYSGEIQDSPAAEPADDHAVRPGREAWTPWLTLLVALFSGPVGGAVFAGRNLQRLRPETDPWRVVFAVLVGQLLAGVAGGYLAKTEPLGAWGLFGGYALVVVIGLVLWQWKPVAAYRAEHPGRHAPGPDALGVFLFAVLLGLASTVIAMRIAGRLSEGNFAAPAEAFFPAPPAPEPMPDFGFPPM